MKSILESSKAIAKVVAACEPKVISAYPITPQTHIVEALAKLKADGQLSAEYLRAESEFAAASIVLGASALGVRAYSATTSQGLLLMAEVIFNIAGLRLPIVFTCVNRAVSAPINIWNDHQDVMTVRDSGWIILFAESLQEALDMHVVAFKLAEAVSLPVMVCVDGFNLTHVTEVADIPEADKIKRFLPDYKPAAYLSTESPKTFGYLSDPSMYQEVRLELHRDLINSKNKITEVCEDFKKIFSRTPFDFVEEYKMADAEIVYVAMGSVVGTLKDAVDELRAEGIRAGILKISCFRPFPDDAVFDAIYDAVSYTPELPPRLIVIDRAVSLGQEGILAGELKRTLYGRLECRKIKIDDYIIGLGGRDITKEDLKKIVEQ